MKCIKIGLKGFTIAVLVLFVTNSIAKSYNWSDITQQQYIDNLVSCETQLEEYKWSKNLWPKENKTKKPAFSEVLDTDKIRQQVLDNFKRQNILSKKFNYDINDAMLQNDLDRMARNTKDAKGLKALYAMFDNDATTIAQCISRPYLVQKKLQNSYNWHNEIHQDTYQLANKEMQKYLASKSLEGLIAQEITVIYTLNNDDKAKKSLTQDDFENKEVFIELDEPEFKQKIQQLTGNDKIDLVLDTLQSIPPKGVQQKPYNFIYTEILDQSQDSITVKTLSWQKQRLNTWLQTQVTTALSYQPIKMTLSLTNISSKAKDFSKAAVTADTWKSQYYPEARQYHTAVWSGSQMIVWGGFVNGGIRLNTGGRYDPATDVWLSTSTTGAPSGRGLHTAVWSGSQMVVWGGRDENYNRLNTGGRYDPVTDIWLSTSTTGAPSGRENHTAVWTGSVMIVWGGDDGYYLNTGGRYDPSTDIWLSTSKSHTAVPSSRYSHTAVWSGSLMIVWGGLDESGHSTNTGGRYDPITDIWLPTSTTAVPSGRYYHTAVWSGSQMLVWGGLGASNTQLNTGGRYDPVTNIWLSINTTGAPSSRRSHTAVWSGSQMVVWGGFDVSGYSNTGGRYDPSTDIWSATSPTGTPSSRQRHTAVWSGSQMVVWGGIGTGGFSNTGGRYDPSTDIWLTTSPTGIPPSGIPPSGRTYHTAIWSGSQMVVWGGLGDSSTILNTGGRYDPVTDSWLSTSATGAPSARYYHTAVWSGSQMVVWGGLGGGALDLNTGSRYDPVTDSWLSTSTTDAPSARRFHTAVWSGSQMVVWGGYDGGNFNTGGRYDPVTDIWLPTSTTDAPSDRRLHTALWSGSQMIVWGGFDNSSYSNTGGRYNPVTDSWLSTSTTGAPSARRLQTVVWSGNQMVLWGGFDGGNLNTGGRYDPVADSWLSISATGAPSSRRSHTAVWSGSQMIVWGGLDGGHANTGGRYDPVTDIWLATSTIGAPIGRQRHKAVWSGNEMLVWGGHSGAAYLNSMGVYYATNTYNIGGTLTGLNGSQVILQNNGGDDLSLASDGGFAFVTAILEDGSYDVTVLTNPISPSQICAVTNGSGTNIMANVSNVGVTCTTNQYVIGVTVLGLGVGSVVLQNNTGDDLSIATNGSYTFAALDDLSPYTVTVLTQPTAPNQTCAVTGGDNNDGTGALSGADDLSIVVTCVTDKYSVGVTVSGLGAGSVVLQNNASNDLNIATDGSYTFTALDDLSPYAVTVLTQPSAPNQTCSITGGDNADGTGALSGVDDLSIVVTCVTNKYSVGVTVSGLGAGSVILQNNSGDDLTIATDGSYTFAMQLDDLSPYAVTVLTQPTTPNQTCAVTGGDNNNGTGALSGADDLSILVNCVTNKYSVGVTVSGLASGNSVVLQNNDGDDLTVSDGAINNFSTALDDGTDYLITVFSNPITPSQICTVMSGTGSFNGMDVVVSVVCATEQFYIGGMTSGLVTGNPVALNLGAENLFVDTATFVFTNPMDDESNYTVIINSEPLSPSQTCSLVNATGQIMASDVIDIEVNCITNQYSIGGTVTGIHAGNNLQLQNNLSDTTVISEEGNFSFAAKLDDLSPYVISVLSDANNPMQPCSVFNTSGALAGADVNTVLIVCDYGTDLMFLSGFE